jgi:uncharacterized protein YciI
MPFMIETWDRPDAAAVRAKTRAAHVAYLEANLDKLLGAGAKLADDGETALGTLYIVTTDDRNEAQRFVADDPFTKAGVPGQIVVTRWRKAIFDSKSFIAK